MGADWFLNLKIDAVAADHAAHRADTEAHGTVYRVKESGEWVFCERTVVFFYWTVW
ncbi:MAG: hypothetical protein FD174_3529 [Geobacteraceae bacterium]|nr:MAG: hypothetical protein FD174_3529 [Geobacteraceae bacterium]